MAQTIAEINEIKVVEMGYRPPRVKHDELWWNVYRNGEFIKGFHWFAEENAGDALQFAINLAGICDVPID